VDQVIRFLARVERPKLVLHLVLAEFVGLLVHGEKVRISLAHGLSQYLLRPASVKEFEVARLWSAVGVEEAQFLEQADQQPVVCAGKSEVFQKFVRESFWSLRIEDGVEVGRD